jgi:hypothetical protein
MEVGLGVLGEVKVDDDIYGLNIDTTGKEIRAHQVAANPISEVVEDAVTVVLEHFGVGVEARVSQLGDLLCQQLDSVGRVAEYDRLVDL